MQMFLLLPYTFSMKEINRSACTYAKRALDVDPFWNYEEQTVYLNEAVKLGIVFG